MLICKAFFEIRVESIMPLPFVNVDIDHTGILIIFVSFQNVHMPDAYDRLIMDVFSGSQLNFVRRYDSRHSF